MSGFFVFLNMMSRKVILLYTTVILMLFSAGCGRRQEGVDALRRSKADALNKASFALRYNDSHRSELYARKALAYIDDSLKEYADGRLRAWNNIAVAYYNRAEHDSAAAYADSVLAFRGQCHNGGVEQMLAQLTQARLRQRQCDIAGSYRILYDLEHSGLLRRRGDDLLFNLAQSEFYITTTTLNYHYRNKSQYQQAELLTTMEQCRRQLRCDWAEDMSFNYAIAYGYYSLCDDTAQQRHYLAKALDYTLDNFLLLGDSLRFSTYHLANTYQLLGFMLWGRNIGLDSWRHNEDRLMEICHFVAQAFAFRPLGDTLATMELAAYKPMLAAAFLREATALFFLHDDPYQRLGAIVSTGRFCMAQGDTATARSYFLEALADSTMLGVAPKFEAMLYEGFLTSGCAADMQEVADWTRHELQLLKYINSNERADFALQQQLEQMRRDSTLYRTFLIVLAVLTVALLLTLLLLRRRTLQLQSETARLQEAKRHDVERIANVETCLSVLRHDITPFVSYLQNERLPEQLRAEVTAQLIRTFNNIKNWTKLSIPSGLQFRKTTVALQDLFNSVERSAMNFHAPDVDLRFEPTPLVAVGDSQLLEILLRNLVNNALQHTDKGSLTVTARPFDDPAFIHVMVADTGSGMTPEQIETLFRADKKINPTPEAGYGSGFGLILCRYIIKLHDDNTLRGCRIWAESQPGQGSTFHFLIASKQ